MMMGKRMDMGNSGRRAERSRAPRRESEQDGGGHVGRRRLGELHAGQRVVDGGVESGVAGGADETGSRDAAGSIGPQAHRWLTTASRVRGWRLMASRTDD